MVVGGDVAFLPARAADDRRDPGEPRDQTTVRCASTGTVRAGVLVDEMQLARLLLLWVH